ncbi:TlpA family protein disulfide reductase [Eubacteriales bacterium OttesenSCG-928-A19]|nr:TlpA family protein disulfide reductase [Eubacteriales bacterium OttesenSCG-928-A19]
MLKRFSLLLALCLIVAALPAVAGASEGDILAPINAESLNGTDDVTEAFFEAPYITLVNFWATWCGPCIAELPDLAQLSELTGGKVQVVGVMLDAMDQTGRRDESAIEGMLALCDEASVTYPIVMPDEYLTQLSYTMQYVPTTLVVDFEGEVHEVVIGSNSAEDWLAIAQKVVDEVYQEKVDLLENSDGEAA